MERPKSIIDIFRRAETLSNGLRERFPEHVSHQIDEMDDGTFHHLEATDGVETRAWKNTANVWRLVRLIAGREAPPTTAYTQRMESEYRQELQYCLHTGCAAFIGYLSPVGPTDSPVVIPRHHLEGQEPDWTEGEVRWHDIRYVDVRVVDQSELEDLRQPNAPDADKSIPPDADKPVNAGNPTDGSDADDMPRRPGRPSSTRFIIAAYEAIKIDYSKSLRSQYAAIRKKAQELSGREKGFGGDAIRKTVGARFKREKATFEAKK